MLTTLPTEVFPQPSEPFLQHVDGGTTKEVTDFEEGHLFL